MKTKDFSFELPERLIAQHPTPERSSARLMRLPRGIGEPTHHRIPDLPGLLPQDSLLVLNTSRVRKARLFAERPGRERKVECLLLSSDESRLRWTAMLGRAKAVLWTSG
jgi:S-adenosylmethionine:tRNA ribosyltransferase-isomerase